MLHCSVERSFVMQPLQNVPLCRSTLSTGMGKSGALNLLKYVHWTDMRLSVLLQVLCFPLKPTHGVSSVWSGWTGIFFVISGLQRGLFLFCNHRTRYSTRLYKYQINIYEIIYSRRLKIIDNIFFFSMLQVSNSVCHSCNVLNCRIFLYLCPL